MSGMNPSTGFTQVVPTAEEVAAWRKKYPRRHPPYRSKCTRCGRRIWHSGIAIGAHRRACKGTQANNIAGVAVPGINPAAPDAGRDGKRPMATEAGFPGQG